MHTVSALQAGKHIMLEKPITLSLQSAQRIMAAEKAAPNGARVFVGFQRRYAPSVDAFKREISSIGSIKHVLVRDIVARNPIFLSQSGAEVEKYVDDKRVSINYDTPFVKGLGITVEVDELNECGEKVHRSIQTSWEDAYTAELKELYECFSQGKDIKTTVGDAAEDLKRFTAMMDLF